MEPAGTRYLDRDGAAFAYQVVGDGPADVVMCFELNSHPDLVWSDPHLYAGLESSTRYARMAYFQIRGVGLSESTGYLPTIEQQAEDVLAVMDAVGMQRAVLVGFFCTCGAMALVAARAPERVAGLVLMTPIAQGMQCGAEELTGWTEEEATGFVDGYREALQQWGSGRSIDMWDSVLATPYNRRLFALNERCSATPATAMAYMDWVLHVDLSDVYRSVRVPTRVLRKSTNTAPEAAVRHVADLIPGATFHTLAPTPPGASFGESYSPLFAHLIEVVTGSPSPTDAGRVLRTVLFTDLVSSTELLARVGDLHYNEVRAAHERHVRDQIERSGGVLVNVMGDGTFSVFDGPSKAVRCARSICDTAEDLEVSVRAGVHTGEVERAGTDFAGLAVHIGARICGQAKPGEVLVSRTVRDLVAGSGMTFAACGTRELKGVPGVWDLYALDAAGEQAGSIVEEPTLATVFDRAAVQTARRAPSVSRAVVRVGNALQRRRVLSKS